MISRPSFDPTEFSRGISTALWNKLINNQTGHSAIQTMQDRYPPGSTFKLVTAIAGFKKGVIDENTTLPLHGRAFESGTAFTTAGKRRTRQCWRRRCDHALLRRFLLPRGQ